MKFRSKFKKVNSQEENTKNNSFKEVLNKDKYIKIFKSIENYTYKVVGNDFLVRLVEKTKPQIATGVSIAILSLFVTGTMVGSGLNFGYKVIADDKIVGVCLTKEDASVAVENAKVEIEKIRNSDNVQPEIKTVFTIANEEVFQSDQEVKNKIVAVYDDRTDGYGIYVDGSLIVAVSTEDEANQTLESYKLEFVTNDNMDVASFNRNVEIHQIRVKPEFIKNKDAALASLKLPKDGVLKHIISEGETISSLAIKYNTTSENILALNSGVTAETLQIGQELFLSDSTPVLGIQTVTEETVVEKIGYETNSVEDDGTYKGITIVTNDGVEGEKEVQYKVIKENGVEKERVALAERIIKNPVTKEVKVGIKARPSTAPTGSFATPYYGTVTSRYGGRSRGFHTGVDLAGPTGSPVVASDGGTVSFAGWSGGYGKLVKIKHDNGYETYYAHLSSINVSAGQKVTKKELIGKVGNTGNSTGPHLHFEIRKNGQTLNPQSYMR